MSPFFSQEFQRLQLVWAGIERCFLNLSFYGEWTGIMGIYPVIYFKMLPTFLSPMSPAIQIFSGRLIRKLCPVPDCDDPNDITLYTIE
jgi:hypothetical protein